MARWQDIAGYEGLYQVSDEGDIVSLAKEVKLGNKVLHKKQKPMRLGLRGRKGLLYHVINLSKDGVSQRFAVHRLVAQAFLPNPDNLPEINHKDENPLNNRVENLEWCTRQYNIEYSKGKPIQQIEDGKIIAKYKSIMDAWRITGITRTGINNVLTGWAKTAGGYQWTYCN